MQLRVNWIFEKLQSEISAQSRSGGKAYGVGINAGIIVGACMMGYVLSYGSGGHTLAGFEMVRP